MKYFSFFAMLLLVNGLYSMSPERLALIPYLDPNSSSSASNIRSCYCRGLDHQSFIHYCEVYGASVVLCLEHRLQEETNQNNKIALTEILNQFQSRKISRIETQPN